MDEIIEVIMSLMIVKSYTVRITTRLGSHEFPWELLQAKGFIWPCIPCVVLTQIQIQIQKKATMMLALMSLKSIYPNNCCQTEILSHWVIELLLFSEHSTIQLLSSSWQPKLLLFSQDPLAVVLVVPRGWSMMQNVGVSGTWWCNPSTYWGL